MNATHEGTGPVRCMNPSCRRILRSAASIAAGYGPVCRSRIRAAALSAVVRDFKAPQVAKAQELITDGGLIPTSRRGVFRTVSSDGTTTYLSHTAACTCPAGLRGRPCYHIAAARIMTAGKAA